MAYNFGIVYALVIAASISTNQVSAELGQNLIFCNDPIHVKPFAKPQIQEPQALPQLFTRYAKSNDEPIKPIVQQYIQKSPSANELFKIIRYLQSVINKLRVLAESAYNSQKQDCIPRNQPTDYSSFFRQYPSAPTSYVQYPKMNSFRRIDDSSSEYKLDESVAEENPENLTFTSESQQQTSAESVKPIGEGVVKYIEKGVGNAAKKIANIEQGFLNKIEKAEKKVDATKNFLVSRLVKAKEFKDKYVEEVKKEIKDIKNSIVDTVDDVKDAIGTVGKKIIDKHLIKHATTENPLEHPLEPAN